jgi:hypothetical protein
VRYALARNVSTTPTTSAPPVLGEIPFVGGFRRVSPPPEPLALARLRALLLEITNGGSDRLREGLEGFRSWRGLATLCGTEWTEGTLRTSVAARRLLQRRLRALGTAPVSIESAAALPVGSSAHVRGTIRPMLQGRLNAHIWSHSAMYTDNVRLAVEEGHDFFLTDEAGQTLRVIVTHGHLINDDQLVSGDRVSVFGFTDRVGAPGTAFERGAFAPALRAGDDLPLLIRRLPGDLSLKKRDPDTDRSL